MTTAVTFDFHNTLVVCDAWFELEIRQLAAAFLSWQARQNGSGPVDSGLLEAAASTYRQLRLEIMEHGNELPAEACVAQTLARLSLPVDDAAIARGVGQLMREAFTEVAPVSGAIATVRGLRAAGVSLGVISSAVYHPFLEWSLAKFEIQDAFLDITTSASAGYYKSRPELFWHATAAIGAEPGSTVHVGDSYRFDVEGADRAGLSTVWLNADGKPPPASDVVPDLTLSTLEGADTAILALRGR
jgi:FMN phosphatase YigB (HAD superfamily)